MSSKNNEFEKELRNFCISFKKFLISYYGVCYEEICNKKMSHKDIKILIPDLRRISFDALIVDKKSLYTGDVVMVRDSYGNIAPYITPEVQTTFVQQVYDCEQSITDKKDEKLKQIIISENLSKYELVVLCRYFKKNGRIAEYRIANRLLKLKKDSKVTEYKNKKLILKMKGLEEYEEF